MKIIDAHLHFCPDEPGYISDIAVAAGHENTEEHLRSEYKRLGIVGGIVMGNGGLELSDHDKYPEYLRYCIGLDSMYLRDSGGNIPDSAWLLVEKHLQRESCVGIKLYAGYNPFYITDPMYGPCYELAKAYKKPVAVHTGETAGIGAILKYSHPLTLDEAAVLHPDVCQHTRKKKSCRCSTQAQGSRVQEGLFPEGPGKDVQNEAQISRIKFR